MRSTAGRADSGTFRYKSGEWGIILVSFWRIGYHSGIILENRVSFWYYSGRIYFEKALIVLTECNWKHSGTIA